MRPRLAVDTSRLLLDAERAARAVSLDARIDVVALVGLVEARRCDALNVPVLVLARRVSRA